MNKEVVRLEGYEIHIVGGKPPGLRDLYHGMLRVPWWAVLLVISAGYLALNAVFAALYLAVGGISNARPGSFADAFFFSVQTMGTIGYGSMVPVSTGANVMVVIESVVGLVVVALATGLVFARFSQTRGRVVFSSRVAIAPMDGVPTLMIRLGNERRNQIVDVVIRLSLSRTTRTSEGVTIYRSEELKLVRSRAPALARSWMILHKIEPGTPLHGLGPKELAEAEAEISCAISGTDDTSLQPVHARRTWSQASIVFGARLTDILSETPDGNMLMDLSRFHELSPTEPTEAFPHRAAL